MKIKPLFLSILLACAFTVPTKALESTDEKIAIQIEDKTYYINPPLPVETLDKHGRAKDVIAVAKSQEDYHGEIIWYKNQKVWLSYYSNVWMVSEKNKFSEQPIPSVNLNQSGKWCSEFACWCLRTAGVDEKYAPLKTTVKGLARYFSSINCLYKFKPTANTEVSKKWFSQFASAETLTLKTLKQGDILQVRNSGGDEPSHTAIVDKVENGKVVVCEGNIMSHTGQSSKVCVGRTYSPNEIIAVIRPVYNQDKLTEVEENLKK